MAQTDETIVALMIAMTSAPEPMTTQERTDFLDVLTNLLMERKDAKTDESK